ncbi:hypothetical protein C772_02366 [Bhargavaea cecembensis DSE10]|uniref:Lipoprotein n=1 Tax=Bhargavaea cecembensis DSE10 TaxID=1235279 RepID=M7NVL5_9BACL|nr:hypothetical protein [Bhargavaea cecembensis]EMR05700.1 hypothetical protein C772_02366 [Bhargavaea cecembensis DSE10]
MGKGLRLIAGFTLAAMLAGCSATIEERTSEAIEEAGEVFAEKTKNPNTEVGNASFYKPFGFEVLEGSDEQNIVLEKGGETYVLFINPNEGKDSRLFYDLLYADPAKEILETGTFERHDTFGFAGATVASGERVELVAGSGGRKITTLSDKGEIRKNLKTMMEIVRSVDYEDGAVAKD